MLTGLASRRAFFDAAERVLERCQFAETPCAVVVFDLDHFKTINDTFGHQAGDRVLRDLRGRCEADAHGRTT